MEIKYKIKTNNYVIHFFIIKITFSTTLSLH